MNDLIRILRLVAVLRHWATWGSSTQLIPATAKPSASSAKQGHDPSNFHFQIQNLPTDSPHSEICRLLLTKSSRLRPIQSGDGQPNSPPIQRESASRTLWVFPGWLWYETPIAQQSGNFKLEESTSNVKRSFCSIIQSRWTINSGVNLCKVLSQGTVVRDVWVSWITPIHTDLTSLNSANGSI
jgi:hypothetical protein